MATEEQLEQSVDESAAGYHVIPQRITEPPEGKRPIQFTEKGEEQFRLKVANYKNKLDKIWTNVAELLSVDDSAYNLSINKKQNKDLCLAYAEYRLMSRDFLHFLQSSRSPEGEIVLLQQCDIDKHRDSAVNEVLEKLDDIKDEIELQTRSIVSKSRSERSRTNTYSAKSKSSNKSKLDIERLRVRLQFAEKEAALKRAEAALKEEKRIMIAQNEKKEADLHTEIGIIKEKLILAEAEVEAKNELETNCDVDLNYLPKNEESVSERTRKYVNNLKTDIDHIIDKDNQPELSHRPQHSKSLHRPLRNETLHQSLHSELLHQPIHDETLHQPLLNKTADEPLHNESSHELLRNEPSRQPLQEEFQHQPFHHGTSEQLPMSVAIANEFSKFLVKRDLLFSRLTQFNDKPEQYIMWKSDFKQIVHELNVSESEELNLLIKWLGPESSKQATCIKGTNPHNPSLALMKTWKRLNERYGSAELVVASLKRSVDTFPPITNKDYKRLFELSDLLSEIESAMSNESFRTVLSYFNSSTGVNPIVQKLPYHLQSKWTNKASEYMKQNRVCFPPFTVFCEFISEISSVMNNPSFIYQSDQKNAKNLNSKPNSTNKQSSVRSFKTDVASQNQRSKGTEDQNITKSCVFHDVQGHTINQCKAFKNKPFNVRKRFFRDKNLCFKCGLSDHAAKSCNENSKCQICGQSYHCSALHTDGGESSFKKDDIKHSNETNVNSACTSVCGKSNSFGKSCAKIVLVSVYPKGKPEKQKRLYALIDDQSNRSLAKSEFFDAFDGDYQEVTYSLSSCSGVTSIRGKRTMGDEFIVSSLDNSYSLNLPALTECNQIPAVREEIPTAECARQHGHLSTIAKYIPPIDDSTEIMLLIGRDLPEAHFVLDQRTGPRGSPYAQKLNLGWVVIGETCLGKSHQPPINVKKTYIHENGTKSLFPECRSRLNMKDTHSIDEIGSTVFQTSKHDDKLGFSIEDKEFLEIMEKQFKKNSEGYWTAPLPFDQNRPRLKNNRNVAINRTRTLVTSLKKNPTKQSQFIEFMQKMIDNGHAEVAPPLTSDKECWYLPIFGVYHPKKPNQIRVVFDSSAKHMGLSLNGVLMTGPDLANSLLGVLIRFRQEPIAISADIEQMFYQFYVEEKDRDFLRFFWYQNNNPDLPIVEYRMCVHVFGNSPSPSIATYGLRQSAKCAESVYGTDVTEFVCKNFYVDDGLTSLPSSTEAIDLLKRAQQALADGGNLRLHKISSNSREVMNAFPKEDLAKDLKDLDIGHVQLPTQRSLGLNWNLESDCFTFSISNEIKPCTRRGVLSTINSIFDPLGFLSPVVVQGRIIMRDVMCGSQDWDEPLPIETKDKWLQWCQSLKYLEQLEIPRPYVDGSLQAMLRQEVHVFCDASEQAIGSCAYLKTVDVGGEVNISFILGKSKVSPKHGHTIPRLELCAAVMATELAIIVSEELNIPLDSVCFYTDSRVVLGYLNNRVRRFYVYVENRVNKILKFTKPNQWNYVPSKDNPADFGTRPTPVGSLMDSAWLKGPDFLLKENTTQENDFELQIPEEDPEIRPVCLKTSISSEDIPINTKGFEKFSRWNRLVNAVLVLKRFLRLKYYKIHGIQKSLPIQDLKEFSQKFIISVVQKEVYSQEISSVQKGSQISKNSHIVCLNPFLDKEGIFRVGGRLQNADLKIIEKNPILMPGNHSVSRLLVCYYHEQVKHQGRHITEGAIRDAGFWITGVKRLIGSVIHNCVKCRKLRGKLCHQKMADLPEDRLIPGPPFTSVGLDCFGPWQIVSRRTRGGQASSKRWAVIFTCLTSRAVHIEVIEEMSSSSFINALRRFTSIRGKAKIYRSDQGTNFIGALDDLGIKLRDSVNRYIDKDGATWILNPPHASHRGGVWERMIGVTRRILDSLLLDLQGGRLTHEVLVTFLTEVSAIINSRPLVPLSSDSTCPMPLSPGLLLTQKSDNIVDVVIPSDIKDLYKAQWKRVQILAESFWKRWRSEFLHTLQIRRKWTSVQRELVIGDVVLLRDKQVARNDWQMGLIESVSVSGDKLVRTAKVRTLGSSGKPTVYERPVNEMVLLVTS